METTIGQIIKVKINDKEYNTVIDTDNVQRFPANTLIRHLVDTEQVNLNKLYIDYQKDKFTLDEYKLFYMDMGYSVCGFEEIFGCNSDLDEVDKVKIENPLWD